MFKTFVILFILLFFGLNLQVYSQAKQKNSKITYDKYLHLGTLIPLPVNNILEISDYGISTGLSINQNFTKSNFGIEGKLEFIISLPSAEYKRAIKEVFDLVSPDIEKTYYFSKVVNLPISLSVYYDFPNEESWKFQANSGIVLNTLKITDMKILFESHQFNRIYLTKHSLAYKYGVALKKGRFMIGLDYYFLGRYSSFQTKLVRSNIYVDSPIHISSFQLLSLYVAQKF